MCTHTEIQERLKSAIKDSGRTKSGFAKEAGIGESNFAKMLDGKQTITRKTLEKISKAFNLSFDWLLTGDGEMRKPIPAESKTSIQQGEKSALSMYGDAYAGVNCNAYASGDAANMAKLEKENEMLRRENDWLRSLVEAKVKGA